MAQWRAWRLRQWRRRGGRGGFVNGAVAGIRHAAAGGAEASASSRSWSPRRTRPARRSVSSLYRVHSRGAWGRIKGGNVDEVVPPSR